MTSLTESEAVNTKIPTLSRMESRMSKIVDQPENYFNELIPARDQLLLDLETEAERDNIPISLFSYLPLHSPENDGLCLALRV